MIAQALSQEFFSGCLNFFRRGESARLHTSTPKNSPTSYLTQVPSPFLNAVELLVKHNHPYIPSSKLQLSIRFTSRSSCSTGLVPNVLPEGMKARADPVQSIEPHRI